MRPVPPEPVVLSGPARRERAEVRCNVSAVVPVGPFSRARVWCGLHAGHGGAHCFHPEWAAE